MNKIVLATLLITLISCQEEGARSDAYGNFEATTVTVSAEAQGQLLHLNATEGQQLKTGQLTGLVDTALLHLQREQVRATIRTLPKKLQNSLAEIAVLKRQQLNLERERDRVARLVEKKAATPKQLDDLNGEVEVVQNRIASVQANTSTANRGIMAEKEPMLAQIALLDEQIRRAYLYNPVAGTVINKMAEAGEMVGIGSPLYRIGKLDTLKLRAYTTSTLLQAVHVGQSVEVLVDQDETGYRSLSGVVSWIADQAEFTPKTIQTKEDRVNLVYAFEVAVPNPDGKLKIGMPAEVNFATATASKKEN
ncbi:MAG: HlyD family efflux transporter periplasmic adaptor subunit [Bacteroidota bacterium]